MILEAGTEEWSTALDVESVDVCPMLQQKSSDGQLVVLAGETQGRKSDGVHCIDSRSVAEECARQISHGDRRVRQDKSEGQTLPLMQEKDDWRCALR